MSSPIQVERILSPSSEDTTMAPIPPQNPKGGARPKKSLPGDVELLVFDILNIFRRRWKFLICVQSSVLNAQVLMSKPEIDNLDTLADNDVNGIIAATIRDVPAAAHKFMVSSPKVIKQKAALQERKRKRDEKKVASNKKKKKGSDLSLDKPDTDSDDEEPQPVTPITVYVLIPKKPLLTTIGSKSRSKASTVDDTLQKGPFTLLSTDDYQQFLSKLTITLPCQKPNIHQSKIQWKTKKPTNAPYLPLDGEAGFSAMITETTFRKPADHVILLSMPPPAVPMEDENPWPTEITRRKKVDLTIDSIQQQKITFNKATKTERSLLEEEYLIGNHVQFPNKRTYYNTKTSFYFELNASRLGVWSAAMAQKKTDVKAPPMDSQFFDANQRIKNVSDALPAPVPTVPSTLPNTPVAATAGLSISDIIIASLLSQSGGLSGLFPNLPAVLQGPSAPQAPSSPTLSNTSGPRPAPPSPIRRHSITAEKFCELYNIDDVDCERLKDVGFQPGDGTKPKADDDLKEAGFTIFGWKRVHQANLRFKADLAAGMFDALSSPPL
ncbi:hypothetical protein F5888DRAFT_1635740 [Russula emetica]|nr:hypothetical protein F5888DRAFT_1635740 [Russula emetica]